MLLILKELLDVGLVPRVSGGAGVAEDALTLCSRGITLTCADFKKDAVAVAAIRSGCPLMRIGALGISSEEEGNAALEQGAAFLLGDRFDLGLMRMYTDRNIAYLPLVRSEDEIETLAWSGLQYGCFEIRNFESDIKLLASIAVKHPLMRLYITCGTTEANCLRVLNLPITLASTVDWLTVGDGTLTIRQVDGMIYDMLGYYVDHVGINGATAEEAEANADDFEKLFHFPKLVYPTRTVALSGRNLEFMMKPLFAPAGHIAIAVSSVERALHYLAINDVEIDYASTEYADYKGLLSITCLTKQYSGFCVQLARRDYSKYQGPPRIISQ